MTTDTPGMEALPVHDRIAGAPISWGVCEVPGWGYQLAVDDVLGQMRDVGLTATEFGPAGFLPDHPAEKASALARHGLTAVGQFVPVVLHRPDHDPLPSVRLAMEGLLAAGASTVVLAATTGADGYDSRPQLDADGWSSLLNQLDRIDRAAKDVGLTATLHPHVGTMIETGGETQRVLDGSGIGLCLDTGHLLIGGGDPVTLARSHPARIAHLHLKDVRSELARQVQDGTRGYTDAVAAGMYAPLGTGDIDMAAIVRSLESAGYAGWYVLEQDTILAGDPGHDPTVADPLDDIRSSRQRLLDLVSAAADAGA